MFKNEIKKNVDVPNQLQNDRAIRYHLGIRSLATKPTLCDTLV